MEWTPGSLPETAEPNTLGLDGSRLANIKPYLQGYIDQGKLAGASFAIMRDERLAYYSAVGEARIGESPMDSATVHRIYSMSKAITSVALLTLYEQAKFQLDDPLEKYLPEFADPQVFTAGSAALPTTRHANQSITPRHLMTHTSGLTYGFEVRDAPKEVYFLVKPEGLEVTSTAGSWEPKGGYVRIPVRESKEFFVSVARK